MAFTSLVDMQAWPSRGWRIYRKTSTFNSNAETGYLKKVRASNFNKVRRMNVPNLKSFEHRGVQNAELANLMRLAAETEVDGGSMTVEPRGLVNFLNPVPIRLGRVLCHLVVDAFALKTFFVCQECRSQHEQQAVQ